MKRGDVVVVDFPFVTGSQSKRRPAVVVQNDRENQRIKNTIVAMVTGNLFRVQEPTHLLVDPHTPDGASSGLYVPSAVNCTVLYTISQADVVATIGQLSPTLLQKLNLCLKSALDLP